MTIFFVALVHETTIRRRLKNKTNFVEDKDSGLGGPHIFHLSTRIYRILVLSHENGNKM
jgi:hypothetical protein